MGMTVLDVISYRIHPESRKVPCGINEVRDKGVGRLRIPKELG